ncbi:hypothetical protein TNCV_4659891 [Trichonephila clavipes]|uniref:Uncharacterized protein n=1 Tax=Trichonephila clavipes TaxID=2585209 RepID=A0A8X6SI10_TRICX|nr:hypothetical protein TNCV_4659891 [Trichonephila clavipes]
MKSSSPSRMMRGCRGSVLEESYLSALIIKLIYEHPARSYMRAIDDRPCSFVSPVPMERKLHPTLILHGRHVP